MPTLLCHIWLFETQPPFLFEDSSATMRRLVSSDRFSEENKIVSLTNSWFQVLWQIIEPENAIVDRDHFNRIVYTGNSIL